MTRYIMDKSTFTPAYAGNTQLTQFAHTEVTVHPRLSGEYVGNSPRCDRSYRSPPTTRGILDHLPDGHALPTFTPDYAGNTPRYRVYLDLDPQHVVAIPLV